MSPVDPDTPPILVTGAPRSGTTFLGRMLSLPGNIAYLDEPFNTETGIEGIDRPFLYIGSDTPNLKRRYDPVIQRLLTGWSTYKRSTLPVRQDASTMHRLGRRLFHSRTGFEYVVNSMNPLKNRILVKDPHACMSAEYLHRDYGMQVVVIVRHPASTIASYRRLGWHYNLADLTDQPQLMRHHLGRVLGSRNLARLSEIEAWSYLWLSVYSVLADYIARNPRILVVTHSDMSLDPQGIFKRLYQYLHLPYTRRVAEKIQHNTRAGNPVDAPGNAVHALKRDSAQNVARWRSIITPEEALTIRKITAPVADRYYSSDDW